MFGSQRKDRLLSKNNDVVYLRRRYVACGMNFLFYYLFIFRIGNSCNLPTNKNECRDKWAADDCRVTNFFFFFFSLHHINYFSFYFKVGLPQV